MVSPFLLAPRIPIVSSHSAPSLTHPAAPPLSAAEVAERTGGTLHGDAQRELHGIQDLTSAGPNHIAWFVPGRRVSLEGCDAGLLLVKEGTDVGQHDFVTVADPVLAGALLLRHFHPASRPESGIHASAVIHSSAELADDVSVGPGVVVHPCVRIGLGAILHERVSVGAGAVVGEGCVLHANVVLYPGVHLGKRVILHAGCVLGADGFGYAWDGQVHQKVPQVGTVEIGDDCELGANCCVDRGTFGATRLGRGCILDNQVQVGHNCVVGDFAVLCGQVGLAGSSTIESGAMLGGQVGVGDHLTIGAGAQVGGGSKVFSNVPAGAKVAGFPAVDVAKHLRNAARIRKGN